MKKVFKIDVALYLLGIMTAATGFGFHVASHGSNHQVWELWACAHTFMAVLFVLMVVQHIYTHTAWLKGLKESRLRKKRRITILLAIFALFVAVTGIMLLAISGANTPIGLLHYKLGTVFTILAIGHSVKRFKILRRVLC